MDFIPFVTLRLRTKLSFEDVIEKLDSVIEPKKFTIFGNLGYSKSFRGELLEDSFTMIRNNVLYQNSFMPVIKGKILRKSGYTVLEIFMRMNLFVIIFMGFWLITPLLLTGKYLFDFLIHNHGSLLTSIMPMALFVFGYVIMMLSFTFESRKAQKIIQQLLNTEQFDEINRIFE